MAASVFQVSVEEIAEAFRRLTRADYVGLCQVDEAGAVRELVAAGPRGGFSPSVVRHSLFYDEEVHRDVRRRDRTLMERFAAAFSCIPLGDGRTAFLAWWSDGEALPDPLEVRAVAAALWRSLRADAASAGLREAVALKTSLGARWGPDVEVIPTDYGPLIFRSPAMRELVETAAAFARNPDPLLLVGPSGSGKTLLGAYIHGASGRPGPFVHRSAAEIPPGTFPVALFGARAGAYTDAREDHPGLIDLAQGGTLLLDEVGKVTPDVQSVLLRVVEHPVYAPVGSLQTRTADVRWLFAAVDPADVMEELRYRAPVHLRVPSLRERPEDILPIFVAVAQMDVSPEVEARLLEFDWPGNVRQLRAVAANARHLALRRGADRVDGAVLEMALRASAA